VSGQAAYPLASHTEGKALRQLSIGIDGYNLAMPRGTGIATYGQVLARTLADAGHQVEGIFGLDVGEDPSLREVLFFDRFAADETRKKPRQQIVQLWLRRQARLLRPFLSLRALDVPLTNAVEKRAFENRFPPFSRLTSSGGLFATAHRHFKRYGRFLPLEMADPPEIMHWTYPLPVTLRGARNIYTMHDLVPLRLPYTTLDGKAGYKRLVTRCAELGAHICTVSEASRDDIIAQLGITPDQVTNTYQTAPIPPVLLETDAIADAAAIERIFGLPPQGYFLFFGSVEPKKNIGRLLEAYLGTDIATPLVLVGARAWRSAGELMLLPRDDDDASRRIIRLDYLPRELLLRLVRSAKAVLFPSLYEGFGLPVLEALQLGTPVLTSNTSALPEVAGDAAVFVDPYSVASIAEGLRKLDTDAPLRAQLADRGRVQAARFTQQRYLERLEAMYAKVLVTDPA
jgi:glycosyltransferase involved in cell wall biosynthesis